MSRYGYSAKSKAWHKKQNGWLLGALKDEYRAGKKAALFTTIAVCSLFDMELPTWAREAIIEAWSGPTPKSWDDVFGRPLPKGKSVTAERRRRSIRMAVIERVRQLNSRVRQLNSQRESIGPRLFRKVGKEFGVSGGIVSNIYYDKQTRYDFDFRNEVAILRRVMEDEIGRDADADTQTDWSRVNSRRIKEAARQLFLKRQSSKNF